MEEMGGENLYGFVGNDGLNKWDILGERIPGGSGTLPRDSKYGYYLDLTRTKDLELNFCGAFTFGIRFKVDPPAGIDGGFVLQVVHISYNVTTLDGADVSAQAAAMATGNNANADGGKGIIFSEAFMVPPMGSSALSSGGNESRDDWKNLLGLGCTKGVLLMESNAIYVRGTANLPFSSKSQVPAGMAGMPSILGAANIPPMSKAQQSQQVNRKFVVEWDCLKGKSLTKVTSDENNGVGTFLKIPYLPGVKP